MRVRKGRQVEGLHNMPDVAGVLCTPSAVSTCRQPEDEAVGQQAYLQAQRLDDGPARQDAGGAQEVHHDLQLQVVGRGCGEEGWQGLLHYKRLAGNQHRTSALC